METSHLVYFLTVNTLITKTYFKNGLRHSNVAKELRPFVHVKILTRKQP